MTQPDLFTWATAVGGNVVTGLTATAAQWQSNAIVGDVQYGLIRYTFSGSPDLSGVLTAHRLNVSGFANAANNGTLYIVSADNTAKTITVRMTSRLDASLNETGATAPATVTDNGALIQEPSTAKKGQGYIPEEKPNALNFNWALNLIGQWIEYIANGGAIVVYDDIAALKAVDTTNVTDGSVVRVNPTQWYIFEAAATDTDEPRYIEPTTGPGAWRMLENYEFTAASGVDEYAGSLETELQDVTERVVLLEQSVRAGCEVYKYRVYKPVLSVSAGSFGNVLFDLSAYTKGFNRGDAVHVNPPRTFNGNMILSQPYFRTLNTIQQDIYNTTVGALNVPGGAWDITIIRGLTDAII